MFWKIGNTHFNPAHIERITFAEDGTAVIHSRGEQFPLTKDWADALAHYLLRFHSEEICKSTRFRSAAEPPKPEAAAQL